MTKVYIASNFEHDMLVRVQTLATYLQCNGHVVTREWWHVNYKEQGSKNVEEWWENPKVKQVEHWNFSAIDICDILVLMCHPYRLTKFTGANVEIGYALANKKRVCSIGMLIKSCMYASVRRYPNIKAFISREIKPWEGRT